VVDAYTAAILDGGILPCIGAYEEFATFSKLSFYGRADDLAPRLIADEYQQTDWKYGCRASLAPSQ